MAAALLLGISLLPVKRWTLSETSVIMLVHSTLRGVLYHCYYALGDGFTTTRVAMVVEFQKNPLQTQERYCINVANQKFNSSKYNYYIINWVKP